MSTKLCYNCTGTEHRTTNCKAKRNRYHSPIFDKNSTVSTALTADKANVTYPTALVQFNGVTCRTYHLADTVAGKSFASAILTEINRKIKMMLHSKAKVIDICQIKISSPDERFRIDTEGNEIERSILLLLPNPKYYQLLSATFSTWDMRLYHTA